MEKNRFTKDFIKNVCLPSPSKKLEYGQSMSGNRKETNNR